MPPELQYKRHERKISASNKLICINKVIFLIWFQVLIGFIVRNKILAIRMVYKLICIKKVIFLLDYIPSHFLFLGIET